MTEPSYGGLLVVAVIAVAAPMLVALVPAIRVPAVVLEIVAGIAVGPAGLGWVEVDELVETLALVGLAFLLFLAGLEIDVRHLRGRLLRLAAVGHLWSLALAAAAGLAFGVTGVTGTPLLVAVALSATSLGLVVPLLKDAGRAGADLGQLVIAAASIADFAAILLLSLLFSMTAGGAASKLVLVGGFTLAVVVAALALTRLDRSVRLGAVLVRLQDTTAEIRVRIAVALLIGFVALAGRFGLETILGAFLAGAVLNLADRETMSHPHFRLKLEAIGYGFLIPVFFVTSGLRLDLRALLESPAALGRVPLFLLALLLVRGLPAVLYRRALGRQGALAAALLQATSLPLLVTAAQLGLAAGLLDTVTAAALVSAGLLSVVVFPLLAAGPLRHAGAGAGAPVEPSKATAATATR